MVGIAMSKSLVGKSDTNISSVRFVSWGGIGSLKRVKAAAKIGVDTHRLPLNPWDDEKGSYDFRLADQFLPALKEFGVTTIVHIFSHGVPEWFWRQHPEAMPRNEKGETDNSYGSVWHPLIRSKVREGIVALFDYLAERDLLRFVDGVEVGVAFEGQLSFMWDHFWAFDPNALSSYRFFLRGRYGEVARLNAAWGTKFASFNQILPPTRWADTAECQDFLDFYRQSLLDAAEEWSGVVAVRFAPKIWLWLSHFIEPRQRPYAARYPALYMRRLKEMQRADVVIVSVVPGWQTKEEVAELRRMGLRVIGEWLIVPKAEEQVRQAQLAWDLGCDGFFVGTLENLVDEEGALTEVGQATRLAIERWRSGERP